MVWLVPVCQVSPPLGAATVTLDAAAAGEAHKAPDASSAIQRALRILVTVDGGDTASLANGSGSGRTFSLRSWSLRVNPTCPYGQRLQVIPCDS